MRVGFGNDPTGHSTLRYLIVDETISGKYVCKLMPLVLTSVGGKTYQADRLTGLFFRDKDAVFDIHEEELKEG